MSKISIKELFYNKMIESGILKEVTENNDTSNTPEEKEENLTTETSNESEDESSKEEKSNDTDKEQTSQPKQITHEEYNKKLSKEQQELKEQIISNHEMSTEEQNMQMISQIRADMNDIVAILIASKSFDHLFIYTNIRSFMEIVQQMQMNIDFTYLFVLYTNGPRYYGIDEYTPEIKYLFDDIGNALLNRKITSKSDLDKMKNINIFHEIYTDFL